MFGRKKKCKQCGKELIRPEDKIGIYCEICTIDSFESEHHKRMVESGDFSHVKPKSVEYNRLNTQEKVQCVRQHTPNWENLTQDEKMEVFKKWEGYSY